MPRACVLIRHTLSPRGNAFRSGLEKCGFQVVEVMPDPGPNDLLVTWNRHHHRNQVQRIVQCGARIIVAENGWIGRAPDGTKMVALCRDHHNGAGRWFVGEEDRWSKLGVELKPWRRDGDHILVLAQRGIGEPGVAMPHGWAQEIVPRLQKLTRRKIVVRHHPGIHEPPPEPDWTGVWATVTWASGAGIKSIVAGIPCFYEFPQWIGGPAAKLGFTDLEAPFLGDRLPMLRRLAWAQFSIEEIRSGEPFARLLSL